MIVVSDASPLNVLVRIGYADVLAPLFGSIMIPPAVASELSHPRTPTIVRDWLAGRPDWLEIRAPSKLDTTLQIDDSGEVEAISLALEHQADFLLVDDRKARRAARERNIPITGTIGILELASARHLLDLSDAFERLRATDFKIAKRILTEALERDAVRKTRP